METSLYIHIPFCKRKCFYCDFYSEIYDRELSAAYIDVIINQIEELPQAFSTIYIGGGTPSALEPELLERLLKALKPKFAGASPEFTVEANPESLDDHRIKVLLDSGVTRLSIGVQSFDDRKLKKLGRLHNAEKAREAVYLAAKRGFSNISIDLIFGVWGEASENWKSEIEEAVKLPVSHISCYSLTYEKGTPLFKAILDKSIAPIEDDLSSAMYETAMELLAVRGFKQYEISNFAKDEGFRCRHNLNYWENNPYVGLGASAVSYMDGVRAKNVSSIREYIKRYQSGASLIESSEKLSPVRRAKETAAIKIRTRDGIDLRWFREKTGYDLQELERKSLLELADKDLIKYKREGASITGIALKHKGILFCDTVSAAFL
ncbi:MAG: radical SAM family heme chaperone HemW [Candidatus Omnitrophica bacterium]|nr:radical SAM family heme chaperone HemW [Candidatus Omnitrophota bacterium]